MEKLTRILAVADKVEDGAVLLEKAVALARRFGAHIELLLHESLHAQAFATLCSTLHYDEVTLSSMPRGAGPLHEAVLRHALATHPDLIMKAACGSHPLRRWTLGESDFRLTSESLSPVLLLRHRAWSNPARFAAAVDVADDASAEQARAILQTAGFIALGCGAQMDILYSERERVDERVRMARAVKLARLVREFHVGCERIELYDGMPESTLPAIATARRYDVLVLGARSHQPARKALFGTTTSQMADATEGDVLLVNAPLRELKAARAAFSLGEQRPDEREQLL
ncbi:MAG: universal stress protein [Pseudomonadota bacterium]